MKRMLLIVIAAALIGSIAFAQSNQVLSRNAVGYAKVVAPRGNFALVRNDFKALSGTANPSNLFGLSTFPLGTRLYVWDRGGQQYAFENFLSNKADNIHWEPGTNILTTGSGFWIQVPGTAPSNNYTAFMMGEVPDRFTSPTATYFVAEGFNLLGYPFPADALWTNTELAKNAKLGDALWTFTTNGYDRNTLTSNKADGVHWDNTTQFMYVAQGYWFKRNTGNGTMTWNQPKPYTWP